MIPIASYWPRTYIQVFFISLILSIVLMPFAEMIFRRLGVVDKLDEKKLHKKPTPRAGGIVIFLAFAVAVLFPNYRDNPMKGLLVGAFLCLVVGAIDDFRGGVPAVLKLATLIVVTFIMSYFGLRLKLTGYVSLDLLLTLFWIVGVTSAFNALDNMDGLAGGVAFIVSAMFFAIALIKYIDIGRENSLSWFGLLSVGIMGSVLGFLAFNVHPARIFMGDSGSFFLGFTLAALGVMGEWAENRVIAATIPVLILGVPILDFIYVLIARIYRGETRTLRAIVEYCAQDHLSHRLCHIGFSQRQSVSFIYLLTCCLGIAGLLLHNSRMPWDSAFALLQGIAIVAITFVLMAVAHHHRNHQP